MEDHPDLLRRRKAVAWVLTLTENTRLAPHAYEQQLLERYVRGELALDDIPALFASRVHHILYRSRATHAFTEAQLTDLVTSPGLITPTATLQACSVTATAALCSS